MISNITQPAVDSKEEKNTTKVKLNDFKQKNRTTPGSIQEVDKHLKRKTGQIEPIEVDRIIEERLSPKSYEEEFKGFSSSVTASRLIQKPELDEEVQRILRVHFATHVLKDLGRLQDVCGQSAAAVYVDNILRTIRAMRDRSPYDPFLEVLMALYDAMAYQNRWISYNQDQYSKLFILLEKLVSKASLRDTDVEKAIFALEKIGFDTLPYEVDIDFDIDEVDDLDGED